MTLIAPVGAAHAKVGAGNSQSGPPAHANASDAAKTSQASQASRTSRQATASRTAKPTREAKPGRAGDRRPAHAASPASTKAADRKPAHAATGQGAIRKAAASQPPPVAPETTPPAAEVDRDLTNNVPNDVEPASTATASTATASTATPAAVATAATRATVATAAAAAAAATSDLLGPSIDAARELSEQTRAIFSVVPTQNTPVPARDLSIPAGLLALFGAYLAGIRWLDRGGLPMAIGADPRGNDVEIAL